MSIKFTFARIAETGSIDFSEKTMARAVGKLSSEPYLPRSAKDEIDCELIRLTREVVRTSKVPFEDALKEVARDHPHLLALSVKCRPVDDGDYLAEARVETEDDETSQGRSWLRAI